MFWGIATLAWPLPYLSVWIVSSALAFLLENDPERVITLWLLTECLVWDLSMWQTISAYCKESSWIVNEETSKKPGSMPHSWGLTAFSAPGIDHRPVVIFVFLREYSGNFQKLGEKERRKNSVAEIEKPTERESILMTMWTSPYQDATKWRNVK